MSTNMNIPKICEFCDRKFIAKKTTTKYCCHKCNSRAYKARVRNNKIAEVLVVSKTKSVAKESISYLVLKDKELLTINEACVLLNITSVTLRRWIKAKKITTSRIGKKHLIQRSYINSLIA